MHFVPRILLLLLLAMTGVAPAAPLRVALISDAVCTDPRSLNAAHKVLTGESSFQTTRVLTADLLAHLDNYDVYIFPGGTGGGQAKALGVEGGAQLTAAVRGGRDSSPSAPEGTSSRRAGAPRPRPSNSSTPSSRTTTTGPAARASSTSPSSPTATLTLPAPCRSKNGPIFVPAGRSDIPGYTPLVKYVTDMAEKDAPRG